MKNKIFPFLAITTCSIFLFYKYVLQVYPSVMVQELMNEFSINGAHLGNLAAFFFYAYFVTQLVVGILLDRFSMKILCGSAVIISSAGIFCFSVTDSLWLANFSRALMGCGAAFATVCYLKTAAIWFKKEHFAFISGLLATSAMLGAVFGQAPLSVLINRFGWRVSLIGIGFFGLFLSLLIFLFVSEKKEKNLAPLGIKTADFIKVFKNKNNWILTFYSGLTFAPIAVFGGLWGPSYIKEAYQISITHAASITSFSFIGLAIGGPLLGYISDRLQNRKLIMFCGNVLSLLTLILAIYLPPFSLSLLTLLLFAFGFGVGSFMLAFAIGKDINALSLAATVIALINSGDALFGAVTEPLIGYFLDLLNAPQRISSVFSVSSYKFSFLLIVVYLIISTSLIVLIKDKSPPKEKAVDDLQV